LKSKRVSSVKTSGRSVVLLLLWQYWWVNFFSTRAK